MGVQAKIKLTIIELLEKFLLRRAEDGFTGTNFQFDIKAETRVSAEQRWIIVLADLTVKEIGKEQVLARLGMACAFELENFDDVLIKQAENNYIVPPDLEMLTKTVAISTARGILFSELRGTYLAGAVLPMLILAPSEPVAPIVVPVSG
jgi:hypothetical protein